MAVLSGAALISSAQAEAAETEIRGTPEVIDSDILKFGTQRVILWGVEGPEKRQVCQLNGEPWNCHDVAFRKLQLLAGRGEVVCQYQGDPDPFGRRFGICQSGGEDLNAEMIKTGVALAFEEETDAYVGQMAEAIGAGAGLWQPGVEFEEPWVFRRRETPGGYR
ncbi:MAG: thermonuclease family protein [Cypionkella sp.]|uniref:thermonuclease family protein n=1 Tax=Cypionkella sp. TaxID=2811411 RepID=UPI0027187A7A|nr:thermonuclease family protein [Cypionkella sp.]MDO8327373.1 thermonuclease family protein [Cypionkella sp.]